MLLAVEKGLKKDELTNQLTVSKFSRKGLYSQWSLLILIISKYHQILPTPFSCLKALVVIFSFESYISAKTSYFLLLLDKIAQN